MRLDHLLSMEKYRERLLEPGNRRKKRRRRARDFWSAAKEIASDPYGNKTVNIRSGRNKTSKMICFWNR